MGFPVLYSSSHSFFISYRLRDQCLFLGATWRKLQNWDLQYYVREGPLWMANWVSLCMESVLCYAHKPLFAASIPSIPQRLALFPLMLYLQRYLLFSFCAYHCAVLKNQVTQMSSIDVFLIKVVAVVFRSVQRWCGLSSTTRNRLRECFVSCIRLLSATGTFPNTQNISLCQLLPVYTCSLALLSL